MEITKTNFRSRLPEIEAAIDSSVFVAVDGEFTGLVADKGNSHFDLPHERYENIQESATQFLLVQFGLATFHYDATTDTYSHQVKLLQLLLRSFSFIVRYIHLYVYPGF